MGYRIKVKETMCGTIYRAQKHVAWGWYRNIGEWCNNRREAMWDIEYDQRWRVLKNRKTVTYEYPFESGR